VIGRHKTVVFNSGIALPGLSDTRLATALQAVYDALDRITSGISPSTTRGWTYDANGNRLTETGSAASTYSVSSTNNRISSISGALARTYSYDAAGNTTSLLGCHRHLQQRGAAQDRGERVGDRKLSLQCSRTTYPHERRCGRRSPLLVRRGGPRAREYNGTGALIQETLWLGDTPVAKLNPAA